jgi:hypothetical protein
MDGSRTMNETLIRSISLANGLTLELLDASRKVASDRYRIELIERIRIPVDAGLFSETDTIDIEALCETLGPVVAFEKRTERNFIAEKERDAVFNALVDGAVNGKALYYAHPDFARKYLTKTYAETLRRRRQ